MSSSSAILISDRDDLFRGSLMNFILSAGYSHVDVVASAREAMAKLRHERYGYVMIGIVQPFSRGRRLAAIAQRRQPMAKIFLLISAEEQPFIQNDSLNYVVKEHVLGSLLELM
jgi:DNA-binding NtrC family response regulator